MTDLIYLQDFTLLENTAQVIDVTQENERTIMVLNRTIFYPQGGGQPYDTGIIESPRGKFLVEEVRFLDGIVKHIGTFESGAFKLGETITCRVNPERRILNSRLHSAGHVVDWGVFKLGLGWIPEKGYHFPDGPYVEYHGTLEDKNVAELRVDLESVCNQFIAENRATKLVFMSKEEMSAVCHFVPNHLPEHKPARVVLYGDFGVPCGGTHVSHVSEVGSLTIRKIKQNGPGVIRVGYII